MTSLKFLFVIRLIKILFTGYFDAAMKTALHLREYEDKLDPADIYSLLGTHVTDELNLIENENYTCDS